MSSRSRANSARAGHHRRNPNVCPAVASRRFPALITALCDPAAHRRAALPAAAPAITRMGFARIVRIDRERREIELCATSEAVDSFGTIFAYEASRDAFDRWAGNVREMHEHKAVGRRVAVRCDDLARKIYVRVRISQGAPDTWEKVCDGTLRGASIGASNVEWRKERRQGREVPVARRYDLVELSLVDLPSNPDALGVTFVRDGVPDAALLDELPDRPAAPETPRYAQLSLWADAAGEVGPLSNLSPRTGRGSDAAAANAVAAEAAECDGADNASAAEAGVLGGTGASARDVASDVASGAGVESDAHAGDGAEADAPAVCVEGGGGGDGSVVETVATEGTEDTARIEPEEAIAAAALARGRADLAAGGARPADAEQMPVPARAARLAALGAPAYVSRPPETPAAEPAARADGSVGADARGGVASHAEWPPAAPRMRGPFSDNPDGPPDAGVPVRAPERPTAALGQTPEGNQRDLLHTLARGMLLGCGCARCRDALAVLTSPPAPLSYEEMGRQRADQEGDDQRAELPLPATRLGLPATTPLAPLPATTPLAPLPAHGERLGEGTPGPLVLAEIERRLALLEAQPMPGGPHLRYADKTHPLAPTGARADMADMGEQFRALEALAGKLTDPQAQMAVATELIRLQQAAAGLPPNLQAMPRAGLGPSQR